MRMRLRLDESMTSWTNLLETFSSVVSTHIQAAGPGPNAGGMDHRREGEPQSQGRPWRQADAVLERAPPSQAKGVPVR